MIEKEQKVLQIMIQSMMIIQIAECLRSVLSRACFWLRPWRS
ncbi:MAG: hypothetical protein ACI9FB_002279 [Candidatus Azotimanducaceae bacterium]|jgi:hypothetical protein